LPDTVRPRTRCERSEQLYRVRAPLLWRPGYLAWDPRPLALRPAVAGGLPLDRDAASRHFSKNDALSVSS